MGIGRFAFTPLLPLMQDDGLASIADGGLLASVHFLGYWLGAVFATRLTFAPKTTLRLSLVAVGLCTLGMGLSDSLAVWLVLRWLAGLCSAFTLVLVSNYYVKHLAEAGRAELQGWIFSGVGAGIAAAGLGTLAVMASEIGSAPSWLIFGLASLVAAVAVSARMGAELPDAGRARRQRQSQRAPLSWRHVIAYGATGLGYIIPATYLPVMARETIESPLVFGWSWPIFGLAAFLSTPWVARLQRRFSNRWIWAASQVVLAIGLLLPVVHPQITTIIIAGVCVGGTFMIITMMGMMEAHRIAPPGDVLRHIAVLTAAFATGQIIGPVFASALHGATGSFSPALLITSLALLVTAAPLMVRPPAGGPDAARRRSAM
jgi:predicted MFS family arabinose efflux permease